jgi:hypothetical protein
MALPHSESADGVPFIRDGEPWEREPGLCSADRKGATTLIDSGQTTAQNDTARQIGTYLNRSGATIVAGTSVSTDGPNTVTYGEVCITPTAAVAKSAFLGIVPVAILNGVRGDVVLRGVVKAALGTVAITAGGKLQVSATAGKLTDTAAVAEESVAIAITALAAGSADVYVTG